LIVQSIDLPKFFLVSVYSGIFVLTKGFNRQDILIAGFVVLGASAIMSFTHKNGNPKGLPFAKI